MNKSGNVDKSLRPSKMKIYNNNLKQSKTILLKKKIVNDLNINKIIKGYFNLYFKDHKYTGSKFILLKRRRNLLRRIHVTIITLYTLNREKNILGEYKDQYIFISDIIRKTKFIKKYLKYLRKYDLLYSLNQYKFNRLVFLPILNLFTNALALKLRKRRINYINSMFSILNRAYLPNINTIKERSIIKGDKKMDLFQGKFKDLKIISNMNASNIPALQELEAPSLSKLLDGAYSSDVNIGGTVTSFTQANENIHNTIYNSIGYKNMGGIRLEVKGGLKNVDSSFRGLSSVLFRGNSKSNVTYSIAKSKRRIGAFAVKG
ncbi:ribosomal protein 5S [Fusarium oxysporum II5]|nr:ribosomal protein 5S [Fusarium oxysporum II5]